MAYDVYAVGNALVDIQAQVPEEMLPSIGFAKGVMTLVDDEAQQKVHDALAHAQWNECPGGSAANTIIGVADFGGKGAYTAKVGNDRLGTFYADEFARMGVNFLSSPTEQQTGTCVILITPDGERTMLTNLAASVTLGPDDVCEETIAKSKYVYVEGYLFTGESTTAAAMKAIELAKKHGVRVAFTASDPFLIVDHKDTFWDLIKGPVDLLFCNVDEARSLTGEDDPIACAAAIHEHADNVALTLGGEGSILMHEGQTIPIEGESAQVVDTTGAGDMYAAGILYGITNGLTWQQSGKLASHAAARIVSQMGPRLADRLTPEQVAELIK